MNIKHESDASKAYRTIDFGILAPFQTQVSRLTRHHTVCTLTGCFQQKAVNYALKDLILAFSLSPEFFYRY